MESINQNNDTEISISVEEIMNKKLIKASSNCTVAEICQILIQNDVGSVLIEEEGSTDKTLQLITKSDIIRLIARNGDPHQTQVGKISSGPLVTCFHSTNIESAMRIMAKQTIKRLVVIGKDYSIVGIISASDILKAAPGLVSLLRSNRELKTDSYDCDGEEEIDQKITGYCDQCGNYNDELRDMGGYTICNSCKNTFYDDSEEEEFEEDVLD